MKVFKDNRDGDILIMYSRNRYKWLSNLFIHDMDVWGEVWDGDIREGIFTRVDIRYYYEQILL